MATLLLAATTALVAFLTLWLGFGGAADDVQQAVTAFSAPLVDGAAALLLAQAAFASKLTRAKLAWALIALAMLLYGLGDVVWAWIAIVEEGEPFPSVADVAYLGFYVVVAIAVLLFPAPGRARREAIRFAVDSGIVLLGGGMLVWHSLFQPILATFEPTTTTVLALGYPLDDLVLLFAVAALALGRTVGIESRATAALIAGMALMFVADIGYGELNLSGDPIATWIDVLYLASSLAIGFAGYLQLRPVHGRAPDAPVAPTRWAQVLPYAGLLSGFGVLIAAANGTIGHSINDLLYGAIGLTVLVLIRLELTNRENARLLAEGARRDAEARYRSIAGQASDAVLLVDPAGTIAYASPSLERVLGLSPTAVIGRSVFALVHADEAQEFARLIDQTRANQPVKPVEWRLWGQDGTWRQVETVSANLLDDPAVGKIALTTRDIRDRKALRQQLTKVSLHDALTELPNRALFLDRVDKALASGRRAGHGTAVLRLDLDGFGRINGTLGYELGDRVLREVAQRLSRSVRAADTLARLGGDEFGILLDGPATGGEARELAGRLHGVVGEAFSLGEETIELTASIGIAIGDPSDPGLDPTALANNAQVAMTNARGRRRDQTVVFDPTMQQVVAAQFRLETELRRAISGHELELQYQPIVDLSTREVVAAEALMRWNHPTLGRLGPDRFIPLAEESGLIGDLGTWALRTACAEVARWARLGAGQVPRVSVNLAPGQIDDPQLPWIVQSALAEAGASPGWLALELTESQMIQDDAGVLDRLHAIRALGVHISIDDFGTGYSSLAYLQQFPVSHIKIDRSFVMPLDAPGEGAGLAEAIVGIARALGMATIAEGIETERQLERLRSMGCTFGQGYLLGRPLDAEVIRGLIGSPVPPGRQAALPHGSRVPQVSKPVADAATVSRLA